MTWNRHRSPQLLVEALGSFDREAATRLVEAFVAHLGSSAEPYPEEQARRVLVPLRRKRQFELLTAAADALLESGNATFRIRQDYAQGLLDLGMLAAARAILLELSSDTREAAQAAGASGEAARRANLQARGLLGRLHKQRYVNAASPAIESNRASLAQAIHHYWDVYSEAPTDPDRRWHGVNAVALAARAHVDGLDIATGFDFGDVARDLIRSVRGATDEGRAATWDYAVAMEASIGLSDGDGALEWAKRYLSDGNLDAFEVGSTHRQLSEVWQLRTKQDSLARVLPMLEAKLLDLEGGGVVLERMGEGTLRLGEANLEGSSKDAFVPIESYLLGLERAQAVARIGANVEQGLATGFLIRGGELFEPWGDDVLLLTNSHVTASDHANWRHGLPIRDVRVSFRFPGTDDPTAFTTGVESVVWESPRYELDACVLRLRALPQGVKPCPIAEFAPGDDTAKRVFIAGHPYGKLLRFSLFNNQVLDHNQDFIHYRAATAGGSSGSPVFDRSWNAIALHHAGSASLRRLDEPGEHQANEGVLLSALRREIRSEA